MVSQEWIAEKQSMPSAANVNQQLHRFNRTNPQSKLSAEMEVFTKEIGSTTK
jgi:hypothetical protein